MMVISLLVVPTGVAAQFPAASAAHACARNKLKKSVQVGDYSFRSYSDPDEYTACLQVVHQGSLIFRRTNDNGGSFTIGQTGEPGDHVPDLRNGTDVTGRGQPDLIVSAFTGGAHCCSFAYVFELEPAFRLIATLDAEHSGGYFTRIADDGRWYFRARDWTFAYWPGSFGDSPSAEVVLQFTDDATGGGFHLSLDKMRKPAPSRSVWTEELQLARASLKGEQFEFLDGTTLWQPILDMIYSGHSDLAWKFFAEAWPDNLQGKTHWLLEFCSVLKRSPYWADLADTVKDAPPACAEAPRGTPGR